MLLVVGATLLIRSVGRIRSLDLGLDPRGVATLGLDRRVAAGERDGPPVRARRDQTRCPRCRECGRRGVTNRLPLRDGGYQGGVGIDDRPDLTGKSAAKCALQDGDASILQGARVPDCSRARNRRDRPG